ncbi:MAG: nitric oxide reductase activation protein, partial [Sulfurimicrobium sp.]
MTSQPHSTRAITRYLEELLEVEFTFLQVGELAASLAALAAEDREFILGWTRRIASTNIQIAYQFALRATKLLDHTDRRLIEAWALHAMDTYDRSGLSAAMRVIREVENFAHQGHARSAGVVFEEVSGIMLNFVHGLSGRRLKLEQGEAAYTDSETLFLPTVITRMQTAKDNFTLCKAMVAMMWAQTRYGSFRVALPQLPGAYEDGERALKCFHALETLRLEARIADELPGLYREMQKISRQLGETLPHDWQAYAQELGHSEATVEDSLRLLADAYASASLPSLCYQGELRPEAVAACMATRIAKEKMLLRVKLAQLEQEVQKHRGTEDGDKPAKFGLAEKVENEPGLASLELTLDGAPVAPPEDVRQLITSIQLDLGEIPPEYLVPAGPGEYDPSLYEEKPADPDEVWQGTYHEEGATLYPEWDY